MMDGWSNWISQLRALPPGRQALLGVTSAISLAFCFWLVTRAAAPDYQTLYRGLEPEEAARVADALRDESIAYRLEAAGTSVAVPAADIPEARIRVAGRALPSGSGIGFELFDRPAFGVTDFVHRVNYVRAMQGELARSIEQLDPVDRARVQLVVPDRRTVLQAVERRPSASVVLRLRGNRELGGEQARAIVHLVASSVESLEPEAVTVVDSGGRLLAPLEEGVSGELTAGGAPGYQQRVEQELAGRVETILQKTVGPGAVVARVRADMDWTRSETTEEIYDPDSQVARSEQRSEEISTEDEPLPGGVPGVAANGPDPLPAAASGSSGSAAERTSETVNYEISKTVSHQLTPMGRIERLSVAVLVADRAPEEGATDPRPWEPTELALFESLARQAVGFSEDRGDQITVQSAPFHLPDLDVEEGGAWLPREWVLLLSTLARGAVLVVALLLFVRLVFRPALRVVGESSGPQLPARVSELEADMVGAGAVAGAVPEQVSSVPSVRADEGVRTLRNWLNQG